MYTIYEKNDIIFDRGVQTIQIFYNSTDSFANNTGYCNFQLPVQGYYDVYLKDVNSSFLSDQVIVYGLSSPQLRTNYTCSSTNGTNKLQTANKFQPLSNVFLISNRQSAGSFMSPVLFPRCLLQNSIQILMYNFENGNPLLINHNVVLTLELHPCKNVYTPATSFVI